MTIHLRNPRIPRYTLRSAWTNSLTQCAEASTHFMRCQPATGRNTGACEYGVWTVLLAMMPVSVCLCHRHGNSFLSVCVRSICVFVSRFLVLGPGAAADGVCGPFLQSCVSITTQTRGTDLCSIT
jgi:hypothetical protein